MQPILMSHVWKVVETIPKTQLLGLSDHALTDCLFKKVSEQQRLSSVETEMVKAYINSRLTLIRDMALLEAK